MLLISRRSLLQALAGQLLTGNTPPGQATVHRKPKPLPIGAVTHDWRGFLGPSHNAVSTETKLSRTLPPPLVWEYPKGTGYASPAMTGLERGPLLYPYRSSNAVAYRNCQWRAAVSGCRHSMISSSASR